MTVIEASSGTYRSRVDGTIVLSVEIEPRFRAEALALFGMPGTPLALAALRVGNVSRIDRKDGGPGHYCFQAVSLCQDPQFWTWVRFASMSGAAPESEAEAAAIVRRACKVESRNELDTDTEARERFLKLIAGPFKAWRSKQTVSA